LDTSCDSHPIPASKLLASHCRSDRGACGFVLVGDPEVIRPAMAESCWAI
jgi:hypothetical protein